MGYNTKKLPTFLFKDSAKDFLVTSKYVLDSLNLWPQNQNWLSKFMHWFYWVSYIYFFFGNIYFVFTSNDMGDIAYALTIFGVLIEGMIRRVLMYVYRHRLSQFLDDISYRFWPSDYAGNELHREIGRQGRYLMGYCVAYTCSALVATTIYITAPMSKMNTPYMTAYPFHWQKNPYYSLLYAWQGFCFIETVSTICGWNFFFAALGYNCVAQFKLLNTYILKNFEKNKYDLLEQKEFIRKCISHHNEILRLSEELNDIFYFFTLALFLLSVKCICVSAFVVTAVPELFVFGVTYFAGHACQLFLYCYVGNELALESVQLATTVYQCGWENCTTDKDLRMSLVMMMRRAQKPFQLSAGGFGYLHIASFMKILQFSFSVYTLLKKMMEKQNM